MYIIYCNIIETYLRLLGFDSTTKQWREAKSMLTNDVDFDIVKTAKQPKISANEKLNLAKAYILNFKEKHQNYMPVDTKDSKDTERSEVVVPFESIVEFHK